MTPKAEIHLHIEGAAPVALVKRLAAREGTDVSRLVSGDAYRWRDFSEFLEVYAAVTALFKTPEDFADLAEDYLTCIAADGALYCEFYAAPQLAPMPAADYLAGLAEGARRAEAAAGIVSRTILLCARHLGPEAAEREAAAWVKLGRPEVVGFNMGGDERMHRATDFARAFAIAGEAGLGLSCHAGEFGGPESVREALSLGVSRIGHGVRAIEDPALVAELAERGTVLEVCPGSNVALGVFPGWEAHPLPRLRAAGVKTTLNSDDPPYFATSLAREYAMAERAMGFSRADLDAMTLTALEAAFCDAKAKARLIERFHSAA